VAVVGGFFGLWLVGYFFAASVLCGALRWEGFDGRRLFAFWLSEPFVAHITP
jgi:hypothetical protein